MASERRLVYMTAIRASETCLKKEERKRRKNADVLRCRLHAPFAFYQLLLEPSSPASLPCFLVFSKYSGNRYRVVWFCIILNKRIGWDVLAKLTRSRPLCWKRANTRREWRRLTCAIRWTRSSNHQAGKTRESTRNSREISQRSPSSTNFLFFSRSTNLTICKLYWILHPPPPPFKNINNLITELWVQFS